MIARGWLATIGVTLGLFVASVAGTVLTGVASATEDDCVPGWLATYETVVSDRPDSSAHGDWAVDSFTRTTHVYCNADGTYGLKLEDAGTFVTTGPLSPNAGVPLVAGITGRLTGSASVTVTSAAGPQAPPATHDGTLSSSEWFILLFPNASAQMGEWGWTYATCGETYAQTSDGETGDVTGATCPDETTTTEPTTTTTTVDTTTTKPTSSSTTNTTPDTTTVNTSQDVYFVDCAAARAAGSAPLMWNRPGYRGELDADGDGIACEVDESTASRTLRTGDVEDLASTGTPVVLPLTVLGLLLLAGGIVVVSLRRRRVGPGE